MAIIVGENLARSFGAEDIFEGITVSVPHGARIALVGPNGTGKTTLLNLLAKLDEPTAGSVTWSRGLRVGYLPQRVEAHLSTEGILWDEMLLPFRELLAEEQRLLRLADELAAHPENLELATRYGELQHRFEAAGGYEINLRIEQVLAGLGFDAEDYQRPLNQLSGGQKTRALLARLLLESPDMLILDEPTNHLDIRAIEWLEGWLRDFPGALLIVSHDRYFMDRVVNHIWELIFGRLEEYRGNYSHYLTQRAERHAFILQEYERQQEFISKEQDYIRRNIAGQNTRQAQGRRKRLERFLKDEAILRPHEQRSMRLRLQARQRSGDKVISTRKLVIGYHDDRVPLFAVPDITLTRGECAALIGPNGAGKSTFMKTILGKLTPLEGQVSIGASVDVGYFAQAHEGLHDNAAIVDEIMSVRPMTIGDARNYLASFLFTGDDVYKTIGSLSGGERGRVALAKLALSGANLLLLDEPTNHLDIPSQEILEAVLGEFDGTILLITHDRYLINRLATQVWALHVPRKAGDGQTELAVYEGPYDEYLAWREARASAARGDSAAKKGPATRKAAGSNKGAFEREKRIKAVEDAISTQETLISTLATQIESASSAGKTAQVVELGNRYTEAEAHLAELMSEWESLHEAG